MADFRGKKNPRRQPHLHQTDLLLGGTPSPCRSRRFPRPCPRAWSICAIVPWDVVPALKLHELVGHHTEMAEEAGTDVHGDDSRHEPGYL